MSKSKGNAVSPREIIARYGADAARCYVLFIGPPDQGADWSDTGVSGAYRFLRRLFRFTVQVCGTDAVTIGVSPGRDSSLALQRKTARTIQKVTTDMSGKFAFNTAIAALMGLTNDIGRALQDGIDLKTATFALSTTASLLLPFAPHTASECYYRLTGEHVWKQPWPEPDAKLLHAETVELACQINGTVRGRITVPQGASEEAIRAAALDLSEIRAAMGARSIERVVVVPGRLVNFVVGRSAAV
ncbi:class I tRNA ligase family protein [Nocardia sp. CNY236]|uniref:class I tRNA ligase family protein n=1 Tax=Nocardia sp. CNY236 TaxID=1169152 RepID=UPI001E493E95|nr:class I tRNA ligase family protein [Nocardia sp. CNY236]